MSYELDESTFDADFGLDPHVLPQFDLLVADGRITREFADQVIAVRRAAGMPMTPEELLPRPEPLVESLLWVKEFGGPEIRASYQRDGHVEIQGLRWNWFSSSDLKLPATLSSHLHREGVHAGWFRLRQGSKNSCVEWESYKILARRPGKEKEDVDLLGVGAEGSAGDFFTALSEALAWKFNEITVADQTWYQTGDASWLVPGWNRDQMRVRQTKAVTSSGGTFDWHWESCPEELRDFLITVDIPSLSGFAATREEAMLEASGVLSKALGAANRLIGNVEAFEAGKAAGRAELKLEISRLIGAMP